MPADAVMRIRVRGASMEPTLHDGDEVRVHVFPRPPRIGEIVLLRTDNTFVLHRVIARGRDWIRTHGDARPGPDAPVPHTAILGIADLPVAPLRARLLALRARLRATARALLRR